jgi:hypothetical protein
MTTAAPTAGTARTARTARYAGFYLCLALIAGKWFARS